MVTNYRTAILFGLCLALVSCDSTRPHPTAPAEEHPALDAATLAASNTWAAKRQLPSGRGGIKAGKINGIIYVVGGLNASGGGAATLSYNVSTNSWTTRQPLPNARFGMNGATPIKGKLYVTGGRNSSRELTRTLFIYDPATNTWAKGANLPQPAGCGSQGAIGGLLYVYAGCTDVPEPADPVPGSHQLFRYNPATNRWATLAPPPIRHNSGVGGALAGKFYVGGGFFDNAPTGRMHAYDPATNTWAERAGVPHPGGHLFAAFNVLGGKLYAAGGWDDVGLNTNDLSVYDPVSNTWATKAPMPIFRSSAAGAPGGGRFFVIAGVGNDEDLNPVDASRRADAYTP